MEYYHYVNIFETKGLEYILVICFLITFVFFVRRLDMPPKSSAGGPPGAVAGGRVIVVPDEGHPVEQEERTGKGTAEGQDRQAPSPPDS